MKSIFFASLIFLVLFSCSEEDACTHSVSSSKWTSLDQVTHQQNILMIDDYLSSEGIVAIQDESGLRYVITQTGDGNAPCLESDITVTYEGRLMANGTVIDGTSNPVTFPLKKLIVGWQIGFLKLSKGAKATLYIPSGLAYGTRVIATIPSNSNLIFDVTLVDFK